MEDTIVLYPSTGKADLFSMVELGKQILKHHPSISITVITLQTETVSADDPYFATVSIINPSISFVFLPKVSLPPITFLSPVDLEATFFEIPVLSNTNLYQSLLDLSKSFNIKALVIDFLCNPAFEFLSSRLNNIPIYYYITPCDSVLSVLLYFPILDENITESLKDLDILIDVPGIPKIPSKDMPEAVCDRSLRTYRYVVDTGKQMIKCAGLVVNSFESLEPKALEAIREGKCTPKEPVPPIFCVGPLGNTSASTESETEHECLN